MVLPIGTRSQCHRTPSVCRGKFDNGNSFKSFICVWTMSFSDLLPFQLMYLTFVIFYIFPRRRCFSVIMSCVPLAIDIMVGLIASNGPMRMVCIIQNVSCKRWQHHPTFDSQSLFIGISSRLKSNLLAHTVRNSSDRFCKTISSGTHNKS